MESPRSCTTTVYASTPLSQAESGSFPTIIGLGSSEARKSIGAIQPEFRSSVTHEFSVRSDYRPSACLESRPTIQPEFRRAYPSPEISDAVQALTTEVMNRCHEGRSAVEGIVRSHCLDLLDKNMQTSQTSRNWHEDFAPSQRSTPLRDERSSMFNWPSSTGPTYRRPLEVDLFGSKGSSPAANRVSNFVSPGSQTRSFATSGPQLQQRAQVHAYNAPIERSSLKIAQSPQSKGCFPPAPLRSSPAELTTRTETSNFPHSQSFPAVKSAYEPSPYEKRFHAQQSHRLYDPVQDPLQRQPRPMLSATLPRRSIGGIRAEVEANRVVSKVLAEQALGLCRRPG